MANCPDSTELVKSGTETEQAEPLESADVGVAASDSVQAQPESQHGLSAGPEIVASSAVQHVHAGETDMPKTEDMRDAKEEEEAAKGDVGKDLRDEHGPPDMTANGAEGPAILGLRQIATPPSSER